MNGTPETRTPLARRNLIECHSCGEPLETTSRNVRSVRWGFWNAEKQWFERPPYQEHYCHDCWLTEFAREKAAHWEIQSSETLWDVLESADGELVADCKPVFLGGRPWIRVVDGELQCVGSHLYRERFDENNKPVLKTKIEEHDVDQEWFDENFSVDKTDRPTIVFLKPVDETPFEDYETIDPYQETLTEDTE